MILWTKKQLLEALSDDVIEAKLADDLEILEVIIDSRRKVEKNLFIAIKGEINDGNNFIEDAISNGSEAIIFDNKEKISKNFTNYILVKDSFKALYSLANYVRKRSKAKIIAITGSVGKTSTKEMLKAVLSNIAKTYATIGNLNNHFGVPLTLANLAEDNDFAIFELGMNHAGEIEQLTKIVKPNIAIITTVAPVHIEFFKNEQEIAKAKSEIFLGLESASDIAAVGLINIDNPHYPVMVEQIEKSGNKFLSFGFSEKADFQIISHQANSDLTSQINVKLLDENFSYQINSINKAVISNSIIAAATLKILNLDVKKGLSALSKIAENKGRGSLLVRKINNYEISIIDDSYNASITSIISGVEYCVDIKNILLKKRLLVLLGDMLELGEKSAELHQKVIQQLNKFNISTLFLVGSEMKKAAKFYQGEKILFDNSADVANQILNIVSDQDLLYIKGSRGMKMEKIIEKFN